MSSTLIPEHTSTCLFSNYLEVSYVYDNIIVQFIELKNDFVAHDIYKTLSQFWCDMFETHLLIYKVAFSTLLTLCQHGFLILTCLK